MYEREICCVCMTGGITMSYNFPLFLPGKSEKPGFHCDISTGTGKSTTDTHSKRIKMQACAESIITLFSVLYLRDTVKQDGGRCVNTYANDYSCAFSLDIIRH